MDYTFHLANPREMRSLSEAYHLCPSCGRRDYKVYIDNAGHPIHETVGRCNRERHCAYHLPPKEWFRMHPEDRASVAERARLLPKRTPLKRIEIAKSVLQECFSEDRRETNTLWKYLHTLPIDEQKLFEQWTLYCVGTTKPHGNTIWWMIDDQLVIRSGKVMQYFSNGSRKDATGKAGYTTWVHSMLAKAGMIDLDRYGYVQCMFGEHLLRITDPDEVPNVNIVESEKSALIASLFGRKDEIWIAVGSITNLNLHNLHPITRQGRSIMVWPDHDGYDSWRQKTDELRQHYSRITCTDYVEKAWHEGMKPTADIADLIIYRLTTSTEQRLKDMCLRYPAMALMTDNLKLKPATQPLR